MATYALLGATGAAGSSVLRCLLVDPPNDLNLKLLVRSKDKLMRMFPKLETIERPSISIVEGTAGEHSALETCMSGCEVVFMCIGENGSAFGKSLLSDTAAAIVDALRSTRESQGPNYKTPTVLNLRSASIKPAFSVEMPAVVKYLLDFCLHFSYLDLTRASDLYESAAAGTPDLLRYIHVDPGALHDPDGTERTGYRLVTTGSLKPMVSYADLGAAFCEIAERRREFEGKGVGVMATGKLKETWGSILPNLLCGLRDRILHALWLI